MNDVAFRSADGGVIPFERERLGAGDDRVPILQQYLRIALRRRWILIGAVASALVLALVVTLLMTPRYTAVTKIEISREASRVVNIQSVEPEGSALDLEFYQTQYGLLASRSLAERVVRDLRLADSRDFFELFGEPTDGLFPTDPSQAAAAGTRAERLRKASEVLLDNVSIVPSRGSRLVDIGFTSPDPELAARISNAWAAGFIRGNLERRFEATAYARTFLEGRLEQIRRRLEASERALVGYAANQRIITIPVAGSADAPGGERSIVANDLAALSGALMVATAARIQAEARWQQARRGQPGAIEEALSNQTITALRRDRAQATAEYQRLMERFAPDYPAARALQLQIADLDGSIAREEGRVRTSLQQSYREQLAREQALAARVRSLESSVLDLRRRSIQYNIYQREVDTNRELYNGLLQRYKEIGVAGGVGTNNVAVVDNADVPERPSRPKLLNNLALALLAGLGLGIGLALAREQIDDAIGDPTEVEQALGLPLLGVIPRDKAANLLESLSDPKSSILEAYLAVHTNLGFATDHGMPRSLAVTSTGPAEGKSTTAFALALILARMQKRVLLIDGDMRSPSVHSMFDIGNESGLSNILSGNQDPNSVLRQTAYPQLSIIPSGPLPPNAAELLMGEGLARVLTDLGRNFDHIIVDSPPVMGLADAPLIASRLEATVFAVEANSKGVRVIRRAVGRLAAAHVRILGVVLTKYKVDKAGLGYGDQYGYGYGYGSDSAGSPAPRAG